MVADRAVVEAERLAELVGVQGSGAQRLEDSSAVLAASGARDEVPQELLERHAHRIGGKRQADMNVVPGRKGKGARPCAGAGLADMARTEDVHRLQDLT